MAVPGAEVMLGWWQRPGALGMEPDRRSGGRWAWGAGVRAEGLRSIKLGPELENHLLLIKLGHDAGEGGDPWVCTVHF